MSENEDWTNDDSRRRMLAAKAALIDKDYQKSIDPRFADTEFLIEADSFAQHALWREYHKYNPKDLFDRQYSDSSCPKVKWEQDSSGMAFCVGKLLDRPVYINCSWVKLNGHRVCFYTSDSQVVDWKMIEEWLDKVCYPIWDNGIRHAQTNAMNFHDCINHILTYKPKEKTHNAKYIFEGIMPLTKTSHLDPYDKNIAELTTEDCGMAKIATFDNGNSEAMFVRIQSGTDEVDPETDEYIHHDFDKLLGKKIRITIETIEE